MDDQHSPLAGGVLVVVGGFLLTYAGSAIGLMLAVGGLGAAAARYREVLKGMPDRVVREATARGFFHGLVVAVSILLADALLEVYS